MPKPTAAPGRKAAPGIADTELLDDDLPLRPKPPGWRRCGMMDAFANEPKAWELVLCCPAEEGTHANRLVRSFGFADEEAAPAILRRTRRFYQEQKAEEETFRIRHETQADVGGAGEDRETSDEPRSRRLHLHCADSQANEKHIDCVTFSRIWEAEERLRRQI